MAEEPLGSIRIHFSKLEDPRLDRLKPHQLLDIIVITGASRTRSTGFSKWPSMKIRAGCAKQPCADKLGRDAADGTVNLLRKEKTAKCGIQAKRLQCAWDESYFIEVLSL